MDVIVDGYTVTVPNIVTAAASGGVKTTLRIGVKFKEGTTVIVAAKE